MVEQLVGHAFGICLQQMEHYNYHGRHSAQTVKDFIARLCSGRIVR